MPAEDFFALCDDPAVFNKPFFLQTSKTDPEYGLAIARVRNSDTTLIEEFEKDREINHGVFVDIYPLYNCPKQGVSYNVRHFASMLYRLLLYNRVPRNRGKAMRIGSTVLLGVIPDTVREKIKEQSYRLFGNYRFTGLVSSYYGNDSRVIYKYDWFFPPVRAAFEQKTVLIPANAEAFLTFRYGDYKALPPESERVMHHDYYKLDLNRSYRDYYGEYYCVGKRLIDQGEIKK